MIYIDPKKIIAKYINDRKKGKSKGGEKIFPVVARMLDHKYREIRQVEDIIKLYKQERAYVIEYLKDNQSREYSSKSQIKLSNKSLHSNSSDSLPKFLEKKLLSPSNMDLNKSFSRLSTDKNTINSPSQFIFTKNKDRIFSIKNKDHLNKSLNTLKKYFKKNSIPKDNSHQSLGSKRKKHRFYYDSQDKAKTPNETSSHLPVLAKDHTIFSPKGKNRIMRDYYFSQEKSPNKTSPHLPVLAKDHSVFSPKGKNRIMRDYYFSQVKTPNKTSSHLPVLAKDRSVFNPKGKNRIMRDYYFSQVKTNFSPSPNSRKQLEASLKFYISESKKTFKDFKTEKFLEQEKIINKHRY
ncbi:hypothetical protein SteCoe_9271 [Stentor coeruleus]|uniref:Uncharacterized protein n=1 Tax=Stentor coeruleus TaxID=5963 RepID=A0A1R2CI99_9CILI|nr:hypothetical protein SteCoe_9271 [Stentor coeruleus]